MSFEISGEDIKSGDICRLAELERREASHHTRPIDFEYTIKAYIYSGAQKRNIEYP